MSIGTRPDYYAQIAMDRVWNDSTLIQEHLGSVEWWQVLWFYWVVIPNNDHLQTKTTFIIIITTIYLEDIYTVILSKNKLF